MFYWYQFITALAKTPWNIIIMLSIEKKENKNEKFLEILCMHWASSIEHSNVNQFFYAIQ